MNLSQLLLRTARTAPQAPALALGTRVVADYGGLARRASVLAGALRGRFGLAPGARVALIMRNCPQFVELLYGCWFAGIGAVPVNAKLHPREFHYILADSGARLVFATARLAETLGRLSDLPELMEIVDVEGPAYPALFDAPPLDPAELSADDLAWLFYTSGTTGQPKGAMLSHRNLLTMTLCYFADVDRIDPGDCILHAAPISHGSGIYILPHVAAGALQVIPESGGFDPEEVFALLGHHPGTTMFAAPTMAKRLIEHPAAGGPASRNLKTIVYGGGPMYVDDLKRGLETLGNVFVQIYGQGESPMTITSLTRAQHADRDHPRYEARLASVGRAQTAVEVRIAGPDDQALPTGEMGEVLARGDSVMPGYWNRPEASAETLRGGWLHTGDMGVLDEDGFLTLKDRSKDVIISGGSNIYPREIEEVLQSHPDVKECAVIGRPHPDWGEEVLAFVVPRPGARLDPAALDALCLANIARFKRPRGYRFAESLPKNNYGKILKTELRRLAAEAGPDSAQSD